MTDMPDTSNKAPKVLIADDDREIVRFLADRCAGMGFEVVTATNGLQALIVAKRNRPDVLITDVNMPEVDGLSVCMRLLGSDRKSIDVVVVTGGSNPETVERCESFGAHHVRKGPDLWDNIRCALIEIFPHMSGDTAGAVAPPSRTEMRERPLVLLVDDDPDVAVFLSSRLRKLGVDMLYAPDGAQGYRIACREKPSAIISDYFMPNGDAVYLLSRLRNTAATESIPIFVVSGQRLGEAREENLKRAVLGRPPAVQLFTKSFDTRELFAALQKVCGFDCREAQAQPLIPLSARSP